MIDLTKPIRRKYDHAPVEVVRETRHTFRILDGTSLTSHPMLPSEAELIFENVPEPRKPREWVMFLHSDGHIDTSAPFGSNARVIRVVEWPCGVPPPEWPT